MPLLETKGAASAQGFGLTLGGAAPVYIEDVFSTWLYTGNGSTQTITNGIDLSTKGGMVWLKRRDASAFHWVVDTARGNTNGVYTNSNGAQLTSNAGTDVTGFTPTGFSLGTNFQANVNTNAGTYASWTFRKQPKFFDVVTYTGDGTNNRQIAHSLGSVPGCIIAKCTSATQGWDVWHRTFSDTTQNYLQLDTTAAVASSPNVWGTQSATTFTVGSGGSNINGRTYVAYLFAHNAGGFGLTGTDNVISCGSYTGNGTSQQINLGWEPQWFLYKASSISNNWQLADIMRGMPSTSAELLLQPNLSGAENSGYITGPTATGLNISGSAADVNQSGVTYIYIAIRRGPMKTPTTGTSVFTPVQNSNFTAGVVIAGQPTVDVSWSKQKDAANPMRIFDRLRGSTTSTNNTLDPSSTAAEVNEPYWAMDQQNGVRITQTLGTFNYINYFFSRAPGFFDEVCYTGNDTAGRTVAHNLGVVPELIIVKCRTSAIRWAVYSATLGNTKGLVLNTNAAEITIGFWGNTTPTSTVFTVDGGSETNQSGNNYVSYLFATCPGVSKVGSYTGTGALQTINCGFTGGARFVLIKRTDSTGDWFTYDSARGISSGNDPYLLLNSTAAEVTGTNYVDTTSVGFQVTAAAPAGLNANGGTYIFLAIA